MITLNQQLNHAQLQKLERLLNVCRQQDGHAIPLYPHLLAQKRRSSLNALYFRADELVGFASVFFFYETACEMVLLLAPAYRKTESAGKLLEILYPVIAAAQTKQVIFPMPHQSTRPWLNIQGGEYLYSEYEMQRISLIHAPQREHALHVRQARVSDINFLCAAEKACFPEEGEPDDIRYQSLLQDKDYRLLIIEWQNIPVGKAHIHWQANSTRLSDIAILPAFQQRGFGEVLISECINQALDERKNTLTLDVQVKNSHAVKLYTRLGFNASNICDYWQYRTGDLKTWLNITADRS